MPVTSRLFSLLNIFTTGHNPVVVVVLVVVGTIDVVVLDVVGCTVVVVVGTSDDVLLDVVGCNVVVVVGISDDVLLDELELLTGIVVVVDAGTEYTISRCGGSSAST
jgi:hypothetical protein